MLYFANEGIIFDMLYLANDIRSFSFCTMATANRLLQTLQHLVMLFGASSGQCSILLWIPRIGYETVPQTEKMQKIRRGGCIEPGFAFPWH